MLLGSLQSRWRRGEPPTPSCSTRDSWWDSRWSGPRVKWRGFLLDTSTEAGVQVAVTAGGVIGFVAYGPAADAFRADRVGEIRSLYVAPGSWRAGHGRALLAEAQAELAAHGFRKAILWVLPGNQPARRFYESCGWHDDQVEVVGSLGGRPVPHVRYSLPITPEAKDNPTRPLS